MSRNGQIGRWLGSLLWLVGAALAGAQAPADATSSSAPGPRLTLSSPQLRSAAERIHLPWLVPDKLPDFRLKIERPTLDTLSVTGLEDQIRGIEFQLPIRGLWIGYDMSHPDEDPQATFSIQRNF